MWPFSGLGFLLCWRRLQEALLVFHALVGARSLHWLPPGNPREQINTSFFSYPLCNLSPSSLTFVFSFALGLVVWRRRGGVCRCIRATPDEKVPTATGTCRETRSWKTRAGYCSVRACQEFMTRTWATCAAMIYYQNQCFRQPWRNSKSWAFIIYQKYNTNHAFKWKSWNVFQAFFLYLFICLFILPVS